MYDCEYPSEIDQAIRENYNQPGGLTTQQIADQYAALYAVRRYGLRLTKGKIISRARSLGIATTRDRHKEARRTGQPCVPFLAERRVQTPSKVSDLPQISATVPRPVHLRHAPTSPHKTCQWMGCTDKHEAACGASTVPGYSWCATHRDLVFAKPQARRRVEDARCYR